jgi:hypothetical protein
VLLVLLVLLVLREEWGGWKRQGLWTEGTII